MNRIDWQSKAAIDAVFGAEPGERLAAGGDHARPGRRWRSSRASPAAGTSSTPAATPSTSCASSSSASCTSSAPRSTGRCPSGEIMSRSTSDLQQVRMLLGFGILNVVNVVLRVRERAPGHARHEPRAHPGVPASTCRSSSLISRAVSRGMFVRMRENQAALGRMSDVLQANLAGVRVVRSFALEERERARFEADQPRVPRREPRPRAAARLVRPDHRRGRRDRDPRLLLVRLGAAPATGRTHGGLSQGAFFAFWSAFARMTWPMIAVGFALSIVQRGRAGFARLRDVFDAKPEVVDGPRRAPKHVGGSLSVEHLTFAYGDAQGARRRDLQGRARASRWPSWGAPARARRRSRCSSRASCRRPPATVRIDGIDVCELPLASVRSAIGYAQQDAFLFSTTVARNIGFALDDPDSPESHGEDPRGGARGAGARGGAVAAGGLRHGRRRARRAALGRAEAAHRARARARVGAEDPHPGRSALRRGREDRERHPRRHRAPGRAAHRRPRHPPHRRRVALRPRRRARRGAGRRAGNARRSSCAAGGIYAAFAEEQQMASELEEIDPAVVRRPRQKGCSRRERGRQHQAARRRRERREARPRAHRAARSRRSTKRARSARRTTGASCAASGRSCGRTRATSSCRSSTLVVIASINLVRPLLMGDVVRQARRCATRTG